MSLPPPHPSVRTRFAGLLFRVAGSLDRRPWLSVLAICLIFLPYALESSRLKPLWHDELFTFYIAQSSTLGHMMADLRSLDLNPPLPYLLTRWSFAILGATTLSTRLPEIVGYLVFLLTIFQFVSRRMGALFGLFAAALLIAGKTSPLAVEARPYSLLLGFFGVSLLCWQGASDVQPRRRLLSLSILPVAVAAMLLSHIFAVLAIAPLVLAEVLPARRGRPLDASVLAALLLPFCVIFSYLPIFRSHAGAIFPAAFQPDGNSIFEFYIGSIDRELIMLLLAGLCILVLLGPSHLRGFAQKPTWFFSDREWIATCGLLASPLLLIAALMLTHGAFFPRYAAFMAPAVAILATALLGRWSLLGGRPDARAALLGATLAFLISGVPLVAAQQFTDRRLLTPVRSYEPAPQPCEVCALIPDGALLVDASGLNFLELNAHAPATTVDRLFYLTDRDSSQAIAHANIFERMDEEVAEFHLRGHSQPYRSFVAAHHSFYVYGQYDYPEDWLLPRLQADHAILQLVASLPAEVDGIAHPAALYLVTMPAENITRSLP